MSFNGSSKDLLNRNNIYRIVCGLLEAELAQSRAGLAAQELSPSFDNWSGETFLLERHALQSQESGAAQSPSAPPSCLNLDSQERIQVAAALSQFFQLQHWNAGDNLLRMRRITDLCALIEDCIQTPGQNWQSLVLRSSGSMGRPKAIAKQRGDLLAECESWRRLLPEAKRILSLVPAHHLYGLIWTVLLPESYQPELPVLDARSWGAARWQAELAPGDVIVAYPFRWECWLRMAPTLNEGICGISSAGSLPAHLWTELKQKGLTRLIEVYGSSESGGVGTRQSSGAPFDLAPHGLAPQGLLGEAELAELLPDRIEGAGPGRFHLLGRKDGAVKIRGVLVSLPEVERQLREHELVADCRVRLRQRAGGAGGESRLEALIVPAQAELGSLEIQAILQRDLAGTLGTAAWPKHFVFAAKLPLNSMGKAVNW